MAFLSSSRVNTGFREAFEAYRWVSAQPFNFEIQWKTYRACVIGPLRVVQVRCQYTLHACVKI